MTDESKRKDEQNNNEQNNNEQNNEQQSDEHEATPDEDYVPQWAKNLDSKLEKLMSKEAPKIVKAKRDSNDDGTTKVEEKSVETPPVVVAPKPPSLLTRFPKWL